MKDKRKKLAIIYILLTAISLMSLFCVAFEWRGDYWPYFFWRDNRDTSMDFYNSLEETVGGDPYGTYDTVYPPLANAIFYGIQAFVQDDAKDGLPSNHDAVVQRRNGINDPRGCQSATVMHGICLIAYLLVFPCVVAYKFRSMGHMASWLGMVSVLSYGSLTAIERGNIICLAAVSTTIFLFGYDSPRRRIRVISLLFLVLAFGIKIYPCLYGLMLLDKKRIRSIIATSVCAIISFFAPFAFFGGMDGLRIFVRTLITFNSDANDAAFYRYGMRGIVEHYAGRISNMLHISLPDNGELAKYLLAISLVILAFACFHSKSKWERAFDITIIIVIMQGKSTDYTLCFFTPILLLMIYDECFPHGSTPWIYLVILFIFILPYPTTPTADVYNKALHHVDFIQITLCLSIAYEARHLLDLFRDIMRLALGRLKVLRQGKRPIAS